MIDSINLKSLKNSEFLQFGTDAMAIVSLNNPQALQIQAQYNALQAAINTAQPLFNKDQSSAITDELVALNTQRDNLINGINALVLGHTYNPDDMLQSHALALQANISSYGSGIAKESYQSETAILTKLLNDWTTKPDLAAAIAALQLTDWQTKLAAANTAFNAKYLARTQEIGSAPADSMKEKRADVMTAYYTLRDFIDALFTINQGADPFGKTTNELNALIEQYNKLVAGRSKGETPPTPPAVAQPAK